MRLARTLLAMATARARFPPYLVLHVDINETAIAGDGAKGYAGIQTLQLVASKTVPLPGGGTLYKEAEKLHRGRPKNEVEVAVLHAIENGAPLSAEVGVPTPDIVNEIKETALAYSGGCMDAPLPGGRRIMVLKTLLRLLDAIKQDPGVQSCLCILRTNGPDMGDLVTALQQLGYIAEGQWQGYGEFTYKLGDMEVTADMKPTQEQAAQLQDLAKQNRPHFESFLDFDAHFNPAEHHGFRSTAHPRRMPAVNLPSLVAQLLTANPSHRIVFAGLREVFQVWQRMNRYHGKPFFICTHATGQKPDTALELFVDDNAYEEESKGKPGPYIVTVFHQTSSRQWVPAPIDKRYPEVVRTDKKAAYTQPAYYEELVRDAIGAIQKTPRTIWA